MRKYKSPQLISFLVSGFCFGWLCIIAGVWMNQFGRTPIIERGINSAYTSSYGLYNQYLKPDTYATKNFFWLPERYQTKGAKVHRPDEYSEGYTLLLSAHHQGASLLDKTGSILFEWKYAYEKLLPGNIDGKFLYWWQSHVYPDGSVLAIVNYDNRTPAGVGLIKLDKNSELMWHYPGHVHHDFDLDDRGNIYALEQTIKQKAPEELSHLPEPYLDEWITVLDGEGKLLKKINLFAAISNSPYSKVLRRLHSSITGDYLHPNAIKYISAEKAGKAGYLKPESLIVDIRELDSVLAIDLKTEQVYWMLKGPWFYQHDSDVLDNGNLLLFDNLSLEKRSRVIEFDPRNQQVVWEYRGTDAQPLYSVIRGGQQALPNWNVLIIESNGSRLLEVNREGELVWEYYSPVRASDEGKDQKYTPVFMAAHRYQIDELSFLQE